MLVYSVKNMLFLVPVGHACIASLGTADVVSGHSRTCLYTMFNCHRKRLILQGGIVTATIATNFIAAKI